MARSASAPSPAAAGARSERPLLGVGLMIGGMLLVPLLDACAKLLAEHYPVLQISWGRFAFHFLWLLPLVSLRGHRWWRLPPRPMLQAARSLFLLGATVCFFLAIRDNPIPNALTLLFVAPLVVTLLAPALLGERFVASRLVAALVGFVGVLVVLRPATDAFSPSALYAVAAGVCYAFYIMTTRRVAQLAPALLTLFYTAVAGLLVMSLLMPWVWVWPDPRGWVLMAMMGFFAAAGHYLIILACEYASASLLAPFNYTELIGATLVSVVLFDYFPDAWVWSGAAIICGSGLYLSLQELRRPRHSPEPVDV